MKKITLLLLSVLLIATYTLKAQKQFAGEIQLKMKIEGTDDPNLLSGLGLDNMTSVVSVLGNKSKVVQTIEGMYSMTLIQDGDNETNTIIIEAMGMGKYYKKTTTEELKEKNKFLDYSYKYIDEYKEVCGYKCQKVIGTVTNLEDDSNTETIYYVTKEIGGSKINNVSEHLGLEGFPLITLTPMPQFCDECMMSLEAIKITPKKIKEVDFLLPSDAKNLDDEPELKEMFGF